MLPRCQEMRSVERNIDREPSMGEVFEHVIIGVVHIRDDMTVTGLSDVGTDHPPSHVRVSPQKTRTPTGRAARRSRHGGGGAH